MAPIDGAIGMKININLPQTTDVNISKAQPCKASGLGGVRFLRSKSATTLYKYSLKLGASRPFQLAPAPSILTVLTPFLKQGTKFSQCKYSINQVSKF